MNGIRQHIPGLIATDPKLPEVTFETLDELMAVPFVLQWKKTGGFVRFSLDDDYLVAEYNMGCWHVVGQVRYAQDLELPKWRAAVSVDV